MDDRRKEPGRPGRKPLPPKDRVDARRTHDAKPPHNAKPPHGAKPTHGARHATDANAARTDWAGVADWYDGLVGSSGSEFHVNVVHPGVVKLLGDVKGKSILDIGCGQGVLCRLFHSLGASVSGTDAAMPLLELARRHGPEAIIYHRADSTRIDDFKSFADASVDAVTCVLAIQNFDPIQPLFAVARRLLKPGGALVVAMMHPCFRGPQHTQWGWDDEAQYRRVDRYLMPRRHPIVTHPGRKDGKYTWTFHRPLGDYVRVAFKAGLAVTALEEWVSHKHSDSGPRAAAENLARKEIPMFAAMRFVPLPKSDTEPS
jgi:2-polyprenyl-3-methyl-5-hydroxy-6-metoxy-1,4-benzoquinol methylase